jgi:hypothetical protein
MSITTINVSEEQSQYVGQVYEEHYARLRRYFQLQLSDTPEADAGVQETLRHFFFFMEDRCWEAEAEFIDVYIMRIAGAVCSRRLARKRVRLTNAPMIESLFYRLTHEVLKPIQVGMALKQLFSGRLVTSDSRG